MKYWRVEREEVITQVVHVQAETEEEAIGLAKGKYLNYNSWFSSPCASEMTEAEFWEETKE